MAKKENSNEYVLSKEDKMRNADSYALAAGGKPYRKPSAVSFAHKANHDDSLVHGSVSV